jgi:hypothetical protein
LALAVLKKVQEYVLTVCAIKIDSAHCLSIKTKT